MRHGMANRKLGRTSSHRNAMFRNQISSMIDKERIVTTLIKAKELRPLVEKMVTLGREDSVHTRRQAAMTIADDRLVQKLFNVISPRFKDRDGGYTRIIKMGPRRGDNSEMAILEFVDYELGADTSTEKAPKNDSPKKATKKADDAPKAPKAEKPKKEKAAPKKAEGDKAKPKKAPAKKKA